MYFPAEDRRGRRHLGESFLKPPVAFAAVAIVLAAGAFLAPGAPFIIDGGVYYDMARAMAENGALATAADSGVPGAPPLVRLLSVVHDGAVYPQYPSGYAFIAAPLYAAFGVHGLMLMNALGFALSIWLTYFIALRFYGAGVARWAAGVFAAATFAPTYAFGIWPHHLSLAFWLGAVACAVIANDAPGKRAFYGMLAASGLLIGAGFNIRIDVFLAALAVFFWLRLFARPQDRLAPLALLAGMTPGLLAASLLNYEKFGALLPLSYGASKGMASLGIYLPIAAAAGAACAAMWALNVPALASACFSKTRRPWALAASGLVIAAVAVSPLGDMLWRMIKGVYVLVVNLQAHDAYYQAGVERNEYGQLLFWGYPKKALIQSLPWMALVALPAAAAFRLRRFSALGLCALCVAAPICFYALNQWHGGGSYSMRYFLPATPFLAVLAAAGLRELVGDRPVARQTLLAAMAGASVLYLGLAEIGKASDRFLTPASLYPQWLIAAALVGAIGFYLARGGDRARAAALHLAIFALAYAATVNLYEEIVHERTRAEQSAIANDISAPLREGSLVVTPMPILLIPAEAGGVSVAAPTTHTAAAAAQAAEAFAAAGRCVYFHNSYARDLVAPHLTRGIDPSAFWAASLRFSGDPRLAFFTFADAADCRF